MRGNDYGQSPPPPPPPLPLLLLLLLLLLVVLFLSPPPPIYHLLLGGCMALTPAESSHCLEGHLPHNIYIWMMEEDVGDDTNIRSGKSIAGDSSSGGGGGG